MCVIHLFKQFLIFILYFSPVYAEKKDGDSDYLPVKRLRDFQHCSASR